MRLATTLLLALVLIGGGCGGSSTHRRAGASARQATPAEARSVLGRYLDATFAGRHAAAWRLLTAADRRRISRDAYVAREQSNQRLRSNLAALGKTRYKIASLKIRGGDAVAVVSLSGGLGESQLRFVLRRSGGTWRVAYRSSWADAR